MTTKNLSLDHLIRPAQTDAVTSPLILMLHGYGSNKEDLFSFASELPKEYIVISAEAPLSLGFGGNAWYSIDFNAAGDKFSNTEEGIDSRNKISQFIDEAVAHYPIDEQNINLLGFSQGCILSFALALSEPQKFKNVIGLSGYIDLSLVEGDYPSRKFNHLGVYNSHGSADQVIPVDWARKNQTILKDLNIDFLYEEFPVGHGVSPRNFHSFKNWLIKRENSF